MKSVDFLHFSFVLLLTIFSRDERGIPMQGTQNIEESVEGGKFWDFLRAKMAFLFGNLQKAKYTNKP